MDKVVAICAVVLLTAFGVLIFNNHSAVNVVDEEQDLSDEMLVLVDQSGEDVIDGIEQYWSIGQKMTKVPLKDPYNNDIGWLTGKRKVMVQVYDYMPVQVPLLAEWGKVFSDKLDIIAFYPFDKPSREDIKLLTSAGVSVVPEGREVYDNVRWNMAFLDKDGTILNQFYFDTYSLSELTKAVEQFANNPETVAVSQIPDFSNPDNEFKLPQFVDAQGKTFKLEDYKGKMTLLVMCDLSYSENLESYAKFLQEVQSLYNDANIVVICDYSINPDSTKQLMEYYEKYGLPTKDREEALPIEEILNQLNVGALPVYFDKNGYLFDYLYMDGGILVFDETLSLRDIIETYVDFGREEYSAKTYLEENF